MCKVKDIYSFLDRLAPFSTQCAWDNAGLLVGDANASVQKIGLCLDITSPMIEQAAALGISLMVSHHPVIFTSIQQVHTTSPVHALIRHGISAICAHTNLDLASGGVNDTLARQLGLLDICPLADTADALPLGRVGRLAQPLSPRALAQKVKSDLTCGGVRFVKGRSPIETVAVCGGAGADLLDAAAAAGADALITGEAKHHELLLAQQLGLTLIDGGHFCTEHGVLYPLKEKLAAAFPACEVYILQEAEPASYL